MPGIQDISGDQPIKGYFTGNLTAGTPDENALDRAPFRGVITAVEFIPSAAITGAATNNFTLNIRNRGTAGVGTVVPATITFAAGVNAVAQAPITVPVSGTPANLALAAGDVLTVEKAVNGTGLACPDGIVVVHMLAA
jgi:hypothetical protein